MTDFIFLRPYVFILTIPLFFLFYHSLTKKIKHQSYISTHLIDFLIKSPPYHSKTKVALSLLFFSCLAIFALAGPAVLKKTPLSKSNQNTIIIIGMDKTMYADDLKPSRLTITKQKLIDYLEKNTAANTALIAFSGSAHIISPFTDDHTTLTHFVKALNPDVMPKMGSALPAAVKLAGTLITQLQQNSPIKIILITDQLTALQLEEIATYLKPFRWPIDIVTVGTSTGSVVPLPEGGLLRSNLGQLIVAKTPLSLLSDAAKKLNGNLININDFAKYSDNQNTTVRDTNNQTTTYVEIGYLFLFPLLLMPLLFRRGYIFCILLALISLPDQSYAEDAALSAYEQGRYIKAAELFKDPVWQGNAMYRAGKYDLAVAYYAKSDSATAHYNRGNALAHTGKITDAILAYDNALKQNQNLKEAKENKAVLEQWLKEQKKEDGNDTQLDELLKSKNKNMQKAILFLKELPEEPGDLMQKRLQLQQKHISN